MSCCGHNNLEQNAQKTLEMIIDILRVSAALIVSDAVSTTQLWTLSASWIPPSPRTSGNDQGIKGNDPKIPAADNVVPAAVEETQAASQDPGTVLHRHY